MTFQRGHILLSKMLERISSLAPPSCFFTPYVNVGPDTITPHAATVAHECLAIICDNARYYIFYFYVGGVSDFPFSSG